MPPVEEEDQGVFEEDDELDDSEGDDSDLEDDLDDDEEEFPDVSPPPPPPHSQPSRFPKEEPNSPITFFNPIPNPNPNHSSANATAPLNGSVPSATGDVFTPPSSQIVSAAEDSRRGATASSFDDSRRLFQRLWTDDDEITILQGFLEFTTQRGTTHASHQYDTGPFYEQIKKRLQLEFNKNQLIEKLRRLKKKYRNVVNRMVSGKEFAFKSAHEQATFEISRKIWSANIKRSRDSEDDEFTPSNPASAVMEFDSSIGVGSVVADGSLGLERRLSRPRRRIRRRTGEQEAVEAEVTIAAAAAAAGVAVEVPIAAPPDPPLSSPIPSIIEETVKSCLSPLFKELLQSAVAGQQGVLMPGFGGIGGPGGLLGMNPLQLGIGGNLQWNIPTDEKWRSQNILELEVYLKRIELMRDQIKSTLEELKLSIPSSGD